MLKAAQALATATSNTARAAKASAQKQEGADDALFDACNELDGSIDQLLAAATPPAAASTMRQVNVLCGDACTHVNARYYSHVCHHRLQIQSTLLVS